MRRRTLRRLPLALGALLALEAAAHGQVTLEILENLPGGTRSAWANDVSADGSITVGYASGSDGLLSGVMWLAGETEPFDLFAEAPFVTGNSVVNAIAADGDYAGNFVLSGGGFAMKNDVVGGLPRSGVSLGDLPGGSVFSNAHGIARDSQDRVVAVGISLSQRAPSGEAFRWREDLGMVPLDTTARNFIFSTANAISEDGSTIVGLESTGDDFAFRWTESTETLDPIYEGQAFGVNVDGSVVVGQNRSQRPVVWRESTGEVEVLSPVDGVANDVSADGSTIVGTRFAFAPGGSSTAVLWRGGPPLRPLVNILDFFDVSTEGHELIRARGVSDDGLVIVGVAQDESRAQRGFRLTLADCDQNGEPDAFEHFYLASVDNPTRAAHFRDDEALETYGDMVALYGAPWPPDHPLEPGTSSDPSSRLRAYPIVGCPEYDALVLPSRRELFRFEMLLGNEAFSDAIDSTIGLDGIDPADLPDLFAFQGVDGIDGPLDEELALLRGRDLPGTPDDWIDSELQYPTIGGRFVAVYNRLPPNVDTGGSDGEVAYRSNYGVEDATDAAERFPQGHGDAWGYYLRATEVWLELLRANPQLPLESDPDANESYVRTLSGTSAADLSDMGRGAVAKARTAREIVERRFRQDYREDPGDGVLDTLFADEADPERAWSMAEWGNRGALGAYLDWAAISHATPPDARSDVVELGELTALAGELQERVDAAGAGLDPLGLAHNAVPFGIDASGLDAQSGSSHYEQVREAALRAIDTAAAFQERANEADQRLREQDESLETFAANMADLFFELDNRLIALLGVAPSGDPDAEPGSPDLRYFLLSDAQLAAEGLGTRPAPGEMQFALSDVRLASLRVTEARLALNEWDAQVEDAKAALAELEAAAVRRLEIVAEACDDTANVIETQEAVRKAKAAVGFGLDLVSGLLRGKSGDLGGGFEDIFGGFKGLIGLSLDNTLGSDADFEIQRLRIQCWKEAELRGVDDQLLVTRAARELGATMRQLPQLLVNLKTASELERQALGRLQAAATQAQRLIRQKDRLERRAGGDLEELAFEDLAFRVFRARALEQFDAFFDIAARYTVLAARAYSYEFNTRFDQSELAARIYSMRTLGRPESREDGLRAVLNVLDDAVVVNNFNRPLESLGERAFSLRRNLLGIGTADPPNDDLRFRSFLEGRIVQRLEEEPFVRDSLVLSRTRDFGPAIVVPFVTELAGRNVFGQGPESPFGNTNFPLSRNAKIRSFAVRFDGVSADLGIDPTFGGVTVFLVSTGESILRENTGQAIIEDEPIRAIPAVDVFLPLPRAVTLGDADDRGFSPWVDSAQSGGNYLGQAKRFIDSTAQVELDQDRLFFNATLAGRALWNTGWLLIIPGGQWTGSSDSAEIRRKLLEFIWGPDADPEDLTGLTDIRWIVQGYSH